MSTSQRTNKVKKAQTSLFCVIFHFFADGTLDIVVNWVGHFVNKIHEEGKFLSEVEPYPIQFSEIEDEGVLFGKK